MSHKKDSGADAKAAEELLKEGYAFMGEINLELAGEGAAADEEAFAAYESGLTECE